MTQAEHGAEIGRIISGKSISELRTIEAHAASNGWMEVKAMAAIAIVNREGCTMDAAKQAEQEAIVAQLQAEMGLV